MMSTLTVHCQWEDEMVRERTGHLPSYAEAKKMRSLTLHTDGCPRASLRECSSSSRFNRIWEQKQISPGYIIKKLIHNFQHAFLALLGVLH